MRIFKNCYEMIREIDRELLVQGITVPVKHYQNQKLPAEKQNTKELVGVSFLISKPLQEREEMIKFIFPDDHEKILNYCKQEHEDRVCGIALNPGFSYQIRQDMWQKFMVNGETKFDYTYSERMFLKLDPIIKTLKEDKHSRQAVMQIFQPNDLLLTGGDTRIPCSVDYSFVIRNNRLMTIYHMRSNDYYGHFPIDIYLAAELGKWITEQLSDTYPEVKSGSLIYFSNSLHAYSWDLEKHVVF